MKNQDLKINILDFNKELSSLRKRVIEEIKSTITNTKCAFVDLYENEVFVCDNDPDALIKRITKNGRVVIIDPNLMEDQNKTLEHFSTDLLILILKTFSKNPKIFKNKLN